MAKILAKLFGFLKYILLIISIGLVLFGIMKTYGRLDKPLTEAVSVFVPFIFVLFLFLLNIFTKNKYVSDNLFFNFLANLLFIVIIIICLRSMFDDNMILYYKYEFSFNPNFFSDNLSFIEMALYLLGSANVLLIICNFIDRNGKKNVVLSEDVIVKTTNNKVKKEQKK